MNGVVCLYTCSRCGIRKREVTVPFRRPEQDVVDWVKNTVGAAVGADHLATSPDCRATVMDNVMIPIDRGEQYVGGRPLQ